MRVTMQGLLQKAKSGMGCPDWHTAMHSLRLQRLLWIYSPEHVGMNGQIDLQAQQISIWSAAWQGRGAQRLKELSQHGQARASQH